MTIAQLFDLVSPIAIYHAADLCYEDKAKQGWRKLKKIPAQAWAGFDCGVPDVSKGVDDTHVWSKEAYDELFWEIIAGECGDSWTWEWDRWGAKRVKDEQGNHVFSGDESWCFPWYDTAEALVNRINDHVSGIRR